MADEIIYGLLEVFKRANNQELTLTEITRRMKDQGFYQNSAFAEAAADLLINYLNPPIFHKTENYRRRANWGKQWRVAQWLPRKENNPQDSTVSLLQRRKKFQHSISPSRPKIKNRIILLHPQGKENNPFDRTASLLKIGKEIQHTISKDGLEIKNGVISISQDFYRFFSSMDTSQQRQLTVDVHYYASDNSTCKIELDGSHHWVLKSTWLKGWYKENRIEPGDIIYLFIEHVTPLTIRIYTEWERNPDTYRRYKLLQEANPLPSINMPIWQLIREFFEQTQKIAHRVDIAKTVIAKRPEVSEQSVYGCLSANPYLFVRVGEGMWGLKEWNMEQIFITIRPKGSDPEDISNDENLPTSLVSVDYILANIAGEDLVYKILQNATDSLSASQISEKISRYFGIDKSILARTTFLNTADSRIVRLEDGTFILRKNLEKTSEHLAKKELHPNQPVATTSTKNDDLKSEAEPITDQTEIKLKQIAVEQEENIQTVAQEKTEIDDLKNKWGILTNQIESKLEQIEPESNKAQIVPHLKVEIDDLKDEVASTDHNEIKTEQTIKVEKNNPQQFVQEKAEQHSDTTDKAINKRTVAGQLRSLWKSISALFAPISSLVERLRRKSKPPRSEE